MDNLSDLPEDLPVPVDDGACHHLLGESLPSISLSSTQGEAVNLSRIIGRVVIYCYPMTGKPGISLPDGWDEMKSLGPGDVLHNRALFGIIMKSFWS